jgi:tryptophan-rich sensory protein
MDTYLAYIIAFLTVFIVQVIPSGTMKTVKSPWYQCIRPSITPPNFVFPIVWTTLYILIAIALAQTLMRKKSWKSFSSIDVLLLLYAFNLILNVLWSFAYFGNKDVFLALVILILMVISTVAILKYTYDLLPSWVVYILLPYFLWTCFAGVLNTLSLYKKC